MIKPPPGYGDSIREAQLLYDVRKLIQTPRGFDLIKKELEVAHQQFVNACQPIDLSTISTGKTP